MPRLASSGISSPDVLPSSSDARAETRESALGLVRLVEVIHNPGKRACPPLSSARALSGGQVSPGYAGAEAPEISTTRRDSVLLSNIAIHQIRLLSRLAHN
jgi:hypothetical protein